MKVESCCSTPISSIPEGDNFMWGGSTYIRTHKAELKFSRVSLAVNLLTGNHLVVDPETLVIPVDCKVVFCK